MRILAIDPGTERSAWVLFDDRAGGVVVNHGLELNNVLLARLRRDLCMIEFDVAVVEWLSCYGATVGAEVFETAFVAGRFVEALGFRGRPAHRILRVKVKAYVCGSTRAKDVDVRRALLDRWGGKERAIGTKKAPGPLYGIRKDEWAALAVAVTWAETSVQVNPILEAAAVEAARR